MNAHSMVDSAYEMLNRISRNQISAEKMMQSLRYSSRSGSFARDQGFHREIF